MFYLAFENSKCNDRNVTEKFYNALSIDIVPIVISRPLRNTNYHPSRCKLITFDT